MIVSGVKHACATCIRGHRSSSCRHADRQLYEIRKKGRPVSQCPHCRDLRKVKSCHTRCECGETAAEQSKNSTCKCHSGQACSCAGPVHIYQYIPPDLSSGSSTTQSNDDGLRTPVDEMAPMLHTFSSTPAPTNAYSTTATQIKAQRASPYAAAFVAREHEREMNKDHQNNRNDNLNLQLANFLPSHSGTMSAMPSPGPALAKHQPQQINDTLCQPQIAFQPAQLPQAQSVQDATSISKTMRSIGTNTEPLPSGIWPDNLFDVPSFLPDPTYSSDHIMPIQDRAVQPSAQQAAGFGTMPHHCPKARDLPIQDLGNAEPLGLLDSSIPVPAFSTYYAPPYRLSNSNQDMRAQLDPTQDQYPSMVLDHYDEEFDPEYLNSLFDVPGCALPGVQCRCGDDCSCDGCRTHRGNDHNVAMQDLARLDFSSTQKPKEHPAGCCDTRSVHAQHNHMASGGQSCMHPGSNAA